MKKKFENSIPTDEELIKRFQNGDIYAFEQIVNRYKNQLLNYAYRFLGALEDSEDIVQETFLRVFRKKKAYKNVAKFSTWIYTITGNLAKTELRRRKKRKLFSISGLKYDDKDYDIPDHKRGPDERADSVVKDELIQKAINSLSPKFKEVIILRDIQELSYDEISKIVKIPLGTVKSRVNRARLKLQEILGYLFKSPEN
ncbi:MAG: sigma-70 family RNA polymerase sigma factor [Candidatus Helarchaeota archaeon]|nr:sigma-70 family RNA polymerase sigma factor [Candidatus Helarchaeota archaeon]